MRVLVTNLTLASRTGTELYVRDLVVNLQRRGHDPVVYTPILGSVSEEIVAAGIPVVDDLEQVGDPPDVIHGHHTIEALSALLAFPSAPSVFVSHSWAAWFDVPPDHPRVRRFVAVHEAIRDKLILVDGKAVERIVVIPNSVDLDRFCPRPPLPERPRRALVFSHQASESNYLVAVRRACADAGLELDCVGAGVGRPTSEPESILGNYDIVFAKGRAALEAMAVGTAVVLCDAVGLGPMVTLEELDRLWSLNFGFSTLTERVEPELVMTQIARYTRADAKAVSARVRENGGVDHQVDRLLAVYEEAMAEGDIGVSADNDRRAALGVLRTLAARVWEVENTRDRVVRERDLWKEGAERLYSQCEEFAPAWERLVANRNAVLEQRDLLVDARANLIADQERLVRDLEGAFLAYQEAAAEREALARTLTFRLRSHVLQHRTVRRLVRALRDRGSSE